MMRKWALVAVPLVAWFFFVLHPAPLGAQALSSAFTTAALRATRSIQSSESAGDMYDSVAAASDLAHSRSELAAFELIRRFARAKLANETFMGQLTDVAYRGYLDSHVVDSSKFDSAKELVAERVASSEVVERMKSREAACRVGLDAMLRSGVIALPPACVSVHTSPDLVKSAELIGRE